MSERNAAADPADPVDPPGRVVVVGSINTDLIAYTSRLPQSGETLAATGFAQLPGGKGANQAVAAARDGAATAMYGAVGDDSLGAERLAALRAEAVAVDGVVTIEQQPSGVALIVVGADGDNQIVIVPGANTEFGIDLVPQAALTGGAETVLLLQNEIALATTLAAIERGHRGGLTVVWNVAPALAVALSPRRLAAVLQQVDVLVVNENELAALAGAEPGAGDDLLAVAERQARHLVAAGCRSVVATLGAAGQLWVSPTAHGDQLQAHHQPAFPAQALDTVGAGDCYCGVLGAALAAACPMATAMRRASAAAALSVARAGAQSSLPTRAEIDAALV